LFTYFCYEKQKYLKEMTHTHSSERIRRIFLFVFIIIDLFIFAGGGEAFSVLLRKEATKPPTKTFL